MTYFSDLDLRFTDFLTIRANTEIMKRNIIKSAVTAPNQPKKPNAKLFIFSLLALLKL